MAAAHGVHVVYGFEETGDAPSGAIHNSANIVAPDGLVGTYRKLHLGIPLETDRFTPGDALPVFQTDLGPIGIQICYDFYMGPELSRVLAMKGARLLLNPTGRSALPRAREHLEQVTNARAHENLIAAASANRVGTSHGPPEWAGGSVIAAVEFPGFPVTLAKAGAGEEVITATIDFAAIGKWYDLLPWREWRAGPQRADHRPRRPRARACGRCAEAASRRTPASRTHRPDRRSAKWESTTSSGSESVHARSPPHPPDASRSGSPRPRPSVATIANRPAATTPSGTIGSA